MRMVSVLAVSNCGSLYPCPPDHNGTCRVVCAVRPDYWLIRVEATRASRVTSAASCSGKERRHAAEVLQEFLQRVFDW